MYIIYFYILFFSDNNLIICSIILDKNKKMIKSIS